MSLLLFPSLFRSSSKEQRILFMKDGVLERQRVSGIHQVHLFCSKLRSIAVEKLDYFIPFKYSILDSYSDVLLITDGIYRRAYDYKDDYFLSPIEHLVDQVESSSNRFQGAYLANNKLYVYENEKIIPVNSPPIKRIMTVDTRFKVRGISKDGNWYYPLDEDLGKAKEYFINMTILTTDGRLLSIDDFGNQTLLDTNVVEVMDNAYIKKDRSVFDYSHGEPEYLCRIRSRKAQIDRDYLDNFVILENPLPSEYVLKRVKPSELEFKIFQSSDKSFPVPDLLSSQLGDCVHSDCTKRGMFLCSHHREDFPFSKEVLDAIGESLSLHSFLRLSEDINLMNVPFEGRTILHVDDSVEIDGGESQPNRSIPINPSSTYLDLYLKLEEIAKLFYNYDYKYLVVRGFNAGKDPRVVELIYNLMSTKDLESETSLTE